MNNLRELVLKFKNKTISIINCLENEDFEKLEEVLEERQGVIEKINHLSYSKEDFSALAKEFDLIELENRCNKLFENKKSQAREELKKIAVNKNMNKQYNQCNYVDSIYFNKKF